MGIICNYHRTIPPKKGKPTERWGHKANGSSTIRTAGLPERKRRQMDENY